MDAKSLSLELDDYRVLDFTVNSKTKFIKNGDEVKSPSSTLAINCRSRIARRGASSPP